MVAAGKSKRLAITTFIITANLVQVGLTFPEVRRSPLTVSQMISNIVSIAGGLAIGNALGVTPGPGKANWIAASYP